MRRFTRSALVGLGMSLLLPGAVSAQIRASEMGTMTQVIDGTKISVTYSRPRMRGSGGS